MDWDEGPDIGGPYGPYRQSERKDIYVKLINELVEKDLAYKSYKTEEELDAEREEQKAASIAPHYVYEYEGMDAAQIKAAQEAAEAKGLEPVVRFRVPTDKVYEWNDIVKGKISFEGNTVGGDFVIQKRDGMPTYNFAVVVDDHLMEITHVLRGDDHIANTPKQLMIYDAFGWDRPEFGHMTLIINTATGKKLSKRDESVLQFIEQYRELGYLPDAMFNFITLLGWSPVGEDEIFARKDLIKQFDPTRLSKSPASFDQKKLEWVNNQYVKTANRDDLLDLSLKNLQESGLVEADPSTEKIEWIRQLVNIYSVQMSYTAQISEMAAIFFKNPEKLDEAALTELAEDDAKLAITDFRQKLVDLPRFTAPQIMQAINKVKADTGIKGRKLFMPLRIATTRSMHGPGIGESIELLGREKALHHIDETLAQLK